MDEKEQLLRRVWELSGPPEDFPSVIREIDRRFLGMLIDGNPKMSSALLERMGILLRNDIQESFMEIAKSRGIDKFFSDESGDTNNPVDLNDIIGKIFKENGGDSTIKH